jgi:hypothetical protein
MVLYTKNEEHYDVALKGIIAIFEKSYSGGI